MLRNAFRAVTAKAVLQACRAHLVIFCVPVVASALVYRGLSGALHLALTGKHLGLEAVLCIFVCMPMGLYAETVVATMYLQWRRGGKPAIADVREVLNYPGLGWMLTRFVLVLCGWCVVALLVGAVLYFIPIFFYGVFTAFFNGMLGVTHPGIAPKLAQSTLLFLIVWIGSYGFSVSKYSFVLPMFAIEKNGNANSFRTAVERAKRYLGLLRVMTIAEYVSAAMIGHGFLVMQKHWDSRTALIGLAVGSAILISVVTTYLEMVKTEIAAQDVEKQPSDSFAQPAQEEGWAAPSTAL